MGAVLAVEEIVDVAIVATEAGAEEGVEAGAIAGSAAADGGAAAAIEAATAGSIENAAEVTTALAEGETVGTSLLSESALNEGIVEGYFAPSITNPNVLALGTTAEQEGAQLAAAEMGAVATDTPIQSAETLEQVEAQQAISAAEASNAPDIAAAQGSNASNATEAEGAAAPRASAAARAARGFARAVRPPPVGSSALRYVTYVVGMPIRILEEVAFEVAEPLEAVDVAGVTARGAAVTGFRVANKVMLAGFVQNIVALIENERCQSQGLFGGAQPVGNAGFDPVGWATPDNWAAPCECVGVTTHTAYGSVHDAPCDADDRNCKVGFTKSMGRCPQSKLTTGECKEYYKDGGWYRLDRFVSRTHTSTLKKYDVYGDVPGGIVDQTKGWQRTKQKGLCTRDESFDPGNTDNDKDQVYNTTSADPSVYLYGYMGPQALLQFEKDMTRGDYQYEYPTFMPTVALAAGLAIEAAI